MANHEALLERLVHHEVEFVLIGGYAAMIYGVSLMTRDVDVCTHFDDQNLRRIGKAMVDLHPYHRETPQDVPFDAERWIGRGIRNLYLGTDLGPIDFLGEILGVGDYQTALTHSVPVTMPYGDYHLLGIDDLITAKEAVARDRDKAAVVQLRAIRTAARSKPSSS
jgi:hypothetical protein